MNKIKYNQWKRRNVVRSMWRYTEMSSAYLIMQFAGRSITQQVFYPMDKEPVTHYCSLCGRDKRDCTTYNCAPEHIKCQIDEMWRRKAKFDICQLLKKPSKNSSDSKKVE